MQRNKAVLAILALSLCGCESSDLDLCPDNPEKDVPGVCGCGMADVDTDGDGVMDCVDLCPADAKKAAPGICGCSFDDADADNDGVIDCLAAQTRDLCPDNPDKRLPGVCGCDIPDEDKDGDGVMDCLGDSVDLCPNNPDKTYPGVCGCDQLDVDSDGDGMLDCLDACPNNPNKVLKGFCGCDVDDTLANLADTDGDGVVNCLDACPLNPTRSTGDASCDLNDSDGDGILDDEDACPYNASVTAKKGEEAVDCGFIDGNHVIIRNAVELELLRDQLVEIAKTDPVGQKCDKLDVSCASKTGMYVCSNGLIRVQKCGECTVNEETSPASVLCTPMFEDPEAGPANPYEDVGEKALHVEIENDLNLADLIPTQEVAGECVAENWTSIPVLANVTLEAKEPVTIRFEKNGKRCKLHNSLFEIIVFSDIKNINLDIDVEDIHGGVLASNIAASNLSNIELKGAGSITYDPKTLFCGGLIGDANVNYMQVDKNAETIPVNMSNVVVRDVDYSFRECMVLGSLVGDAFYLNYTTDKKENHVKAIQLMNDHPEVEALGGLFGRLDHATLSNVFLTVDNITSQFNPMRIMVIGGVAGNAQEVSFNQVDVTVGKLNNAMTVGGLVGDVNVSSFNNVKLRITDSIEAEEMAGGIAGYLGNSSLKNIDVEIERVKSLYSYAGGLVGTAFISVNSASTSNSMLNPTFQNIRTQVQSLSGYVVGGGFGYMDVSLSLNDTDENYDKSKLIVRNVDSRVDNLKGEGFSGAVGGFVGELRTSLIAGCSNNEDGCDWSEHFVFENIFSNAKVVGSEESNLGGFVSLMNLAYPMQWRNIVSASSIYNYAQASDGSEKYTPMADNALVKSLTMDVAPAMTQVYWFDAGREGAAPGIEGATAFKASSVTDVVTALNKLLSGDPYMVWKVSEIKLDNVTVSLPTLY